MKTNAKFLIFILFFKSIRDGTSIKCDLGYQMTKDNVVMTKEFSEVECEAGLYDNCFSAKGSFVLKGLTCEFLNKFSSKGAFKLLSKIL